MCFSLPKHSTDTPAAGRADVAVSFTAACSSPSTAPHPSLHHPCPSGWGCIQLRCRGVGRWLQRASIRAQQVRNHSYGASSLPQQGGAAHVGTTTASPGGSHPALPPRAPPYPFALHTSVLSRGCPPFLHQALGRGCSVLLSAHSDHTLVLIAGSRWWHVVLTLLYSVWKHSFTLSMWGTEQRGKLPFPPPQPLLLLIAGLGRRRTVFQSTSWHCPVAGNASWKPCAHLL